MVRRKKPGTVSGEYCFVIQLVEYQDGIDRVRFGYYKRKSDSKNFMWGSQTTYQAPVEFTKDFIELAKNEGIL